MKNIIHSLLLILVINFPADILAQNKGKRIVIVVSSYGKDLGKSRPGFEMDEFTQAYLIFKANGLAIDVASPKGGKVDLGQFNKNKPYNKIVLQDSTAMTFFEQTKATATLDAKNYDAVYIVGGKGPMFDLVVDPSLQDFILEMDKKKAIVAAVCHGTIALANIKDSDRYLVENKSLTGFCNEEEAMFGKSTSEFPFLLEDRLLLRSARYKKGGPMLPYMIRDSNYITGQNPYSTTLVAEEIIKALGKTPVPRMKFKDEQSMELVSKVVLGDTVWAKSELKRNPANFDLELIAAYGYYQALNAGDDLEKIKNAVAIMELATPYYFNEKMYIPLAEFYIKSGEKLKAIEILNMVLNKNPGAQKAKNLFLKLKEQAD